MQEKLIQTTTEKAYSIQFEGQEFEFYKTITYNKDTNIDIDGTKWEFIHGSEDTILELPESKQKELTDYIDNIII